MLDTIDSATVISAWKLPVALPKSLNDAIDVFTELRWTQRPNINIEDSEITADNVGQVVNDLAVAMAAEAQFVEARIKLSAVLSRNVLWAATAAVPEIIESLKPEFGRAVAEYTDAVSELPDEINSNTLFEAGGLAFDAYHRASTSAATISKIAGWLTSLAQLPNLGTESANPVLSVLSPTTREQWRQIERARNTAADQYFTAVNPLYVAAVRAGVPFEMNTPKQSAAVLARISALPAQNQAATDFHLH